MAQLKSTSVTGNLSVTGNVVASQIIKLDGTNKHLLAADGSVYNLDNFTSGIKFSGDGVAVGGHKYSIYTEQYIRASWLQHLSSNLNSANYDKICITDNNGWIYYRTKTQFIQDLDLSQVYNYKGTLEDLNALKSVASARVGDVYFISATNDSWACKQKVTSATGDNYANYWSNLGKNVDLSGYMTLDTEQTITGKKTFNNIHAATFNGNATSASQFASAQTIALTGDVTGSASSVAGWSIATSLPARLKNYQNGSYAVSDANNATETGFYYMATTSAGGGNRPPFANTTNDYRILTTAYSADWLQQIATNYRSNEIFFRRRDNEQSTKWTPWVQIQTTESADLRYALLDGTNANGTWSINTSGYSRYLSCPDTRDDTRYNDTTQIPTGVQFDFKTKATITSTGETTGPSSAYVGVMTWRSYGSLTDYTGGPAIQIAYDYSGNLWSRVNNDGNSTSNNWNLWCKFAKLDKDSNLTISGRMEAESYNATSDARLKENFTPFITQKSILDLPIYKFDFINGTKNQIGCKAQDLQEICPEIVNEDSDGYLSIQESKIVYLLIDEIKKLKGQLDSLNKTIREEC